MATKDCLKLVRGSQGTDFCDFQKLRNPGAAIVAADQGEARGARPRRLFTEFERRLRRNYKRVNSLSIFELFND